MTAGSTPPVPVRRVLFSRAVVGIVLATFFSDVGHEMATAVLPLFLLSIGLGTSALGIIEGVADLVFSLAKLGGGVVGHHVEKKRLWGTAGYLVTALGTGLMGFAGSAASVAGLRGFAWMGRGFRSPMRDFILSDAVPPTHFGRVYGVERTADMLGAVSGPLAAALLLWLGADLRTVIFVSLAPSLFSAASFFFLTRDVPVTAEVAARPRRSTWEGVRAIPRSFWILLGGVFVFGLGDFSRTFLIVLAATNEHGVANLGAAGLGTSVALYTFHNLVSAGVAFPVGHVADRFPKVRVLALGYCLGLVTNLLLATSATTFGMLAVAIAFSGATIAIEETVEKATCAEMLPRELRSLGLGILAGTNAFGDMLSSVFVGWQLEHGTRLVAFGVPAIASAIGAAWVAIVALRSAHPQPSSQ